MANGRDYRGAGRSHCALQCFFRERQQIFHGAAATGDDDDVDFRIRIKLLERINNLRHGIRTLDRGIEDAELHRWPAVMGYRHHIPLCSRAASGNQPNFVWQVGEGPLACGIEKAFSSQLLAQLFNTSEQIANAYMTNFGGPQ